MISHEQQAEMLVVAKSKKSEIILTSTDIPNENLTNLTNLLPSSEVAASLSSSSAFATATQQQHLETNQIFKKPNLDAAVVLNVKCHCDIGNSHCISSPSLSSTSNLYGFYHQHHPHQHHHHCMNSAYFYELPTKFSLLPNVISGVGCSASSNATGVSIGIEKYADNEKQLYLADRKRCWPPPVFIIFISLLEVSNQ